MPKRRNQKKQAEDDEQDSKVADDNREDKLDTNENDNESPAPETPQPIPPQHVLYCEICSLPPEYCEFGSSLTKCMKWLEETDKELWSKYYSDDALSAKASSLSIEQASKLSAEAKKKEQKANQKAIVEEQKRKGLKVMIKRVERTKRKYVTVIQGLEAFDIDLKAASKLFAQKFATGASVTKATPGSTSSEEIVIQGDVAYDVEEMIEDASSKGKGILASVDMDAVDVVEGKK